LSPLTPKQHQRQDGIISGNKKWWLRHLLMFEIAQRYCLPNLVRLASLRVLSQLEEDFRLVEGWEYLIGALFETEGTDADMKTLQHFATQRFIILSKTLADYWEKRKLAYTRSLRANDIIWALKKDL
jgi:hypothetical protein